MHATLQLAGFQFDELFHPQGLARLDSKFLDYLNDQQPHIHQQLLAWRSGQSAIAGRELSELLIECGRCLEPFLIDLFQIADEAEAKRLLTVSNDPIFVFKQWFVLKQARRRLKQINDYPEFSKVDAWLRQQLGQRDDLELAVATLGQQYLQEQPQHADDIEQLIIWCAHALVTPAAMQIVQGWVSFKLPVKLDYQQLVAMQPKADDDFGRFQGPTDTLRQRDGFHLTDKRMNLRQNLNEIHYCVYCHTNEGDFCSKGFPVKKNEPELGLKTSPLGEILTGCPLEEKISEMHELKKHGFTLAALAMVMVDNPMCPATGHRICNDCMKACIYQKQTPVNIPQTETGILTDVLDLPWGVEIYDLLTRWNPLRQQQYVAKPYNGLKVLVMGMGPAGFSLAHHLLMEGFAVVGCDGLKIEPLPDAYLKQPIQWFEDIKEDLSERLMAGFGGVAEYGITVRWDKNFLKLIYISLMRRPCFQVFGGVRFGGTLTVEDAWELGFDHMAVAVGAGLPRELAIPGSMAPGMRQANDFLMALQLTGAAKQSSLANLQVRLPAVIIGGGLTGIDAATEVQAYYIKQVEKTLRRYELLTEAFGEARVRAQFDEHSFAILNECLQHGREVRDEREKAAAESRQPDFIRLIHQWGGVTVAYRRALQESPAYKRNHDEVVKALEEGIYYAEGLQPIAARLDKHGDVLALVCQGRVLDESGEWIASDEEKVLPARTILVATGAKPNIAYEFEHRGTFKREGMEYQGYDWQDNELVAVAKVAHVKSPDIGVFTSYQQDDHRVTFLGDTHPVFHGSVVKAIASGKQVYPKILSTLGDQVSAVGDEQEYSAFASTINDVFSATVVSVTRHSPSVIEVKVRAPMAVRNFRPGQFYRVQNFESQALFVGNTRLQSEAMAMIGAAVDKEKHLLSLMVMEWGASSRLFATFKSGDSLSVMGPTGVRTKIPKDNETVMIIGGRMGAAHIRAVGPAMRAAGNKVLYIAGFKTAEEVYCQDELEAAADSIVWITETGEPIKPRRPQDRSLSGDFVDGLLRYAKGDLEPGPNTPVIALQLVDRVLVIGTRKLLHMVQNARQGVLKSYFKKQPQFIASIYGPMQCMLKGVCAQCLQWQIDPETGKRTKAVYACSWQDQPMDIVDLDNLDDRLAQNRMQELLTNLWLDYLFTRYQVSRI